VGSELFVEELHLSKQKIEDVLQNPNTENNVEKKFQSGNSRHKCHRMSSYLLTKSVKMEINPGAQK
jgi:hypothetical protein